MASHGFDESSGRETRLLVLVVAVALAVLLLLARFRFPASNLATVDPGAAPLADLAARGTFDELAGAMSGVFSHVSSSVVIVPLEAGAVPPRGTGNHAVPSTDKSSVASRDGKPVQRSIAPALRVRGTLAFMHLPAGFRPSTMPGAEATASLASADVAREIALVRVPSRSAGDGIAEPSRSFAGFSFVAMALATSTGPTLEPAFVGRADILGDARWPQGVMDVGRSPTLVPGSFLFAMDGRFIGMVIKGADDGRAILPASSVEALVAQLEGDEQGGPQ